MFYDTGSYHSHNNNYKNGQALPLGTWGLFPCPKGSPFTLTCMKTVRDSRKTLLMWCHPSVHGKLEYNISSNVHVHFFESC